MKLTQEQIDRLYRFTREHYVEWYDLQTELVDHLANAIESQWLQNPKLAFEESLQIEFKKFGVFGFMDVVEKRQAALGKKYNKLVWSHFKTFFSIPKIIGTASAIAFLFWLTQHYPFAYIVIITLFIISGLLFFIGIIKMNRKNKKETQLSGKKWLFKDIIFGYGSFGGLLFLPIQFLQLSDKLQFHFVYSLVVSVLAVSILIANYIIFKIIPSKAAQYLKETYPEYELATIV